MDLISLRNSSASSIPVWAVPRVLPSIKRFSFFILLCFLLVIDHFLKAYSFILFFSGKGTNKNVTFQIFPSYFIRFLHKSSRISPTLTPIFLFPCCHRRSSVLDSPPQSHHAPGSPRPLWHRRLPPPRPAVLVQSS